MSEFEKMLEKANEARDGKEDLLEYVSSLSKIIEIKIRGIFEQHQKDIMAVDEDLRSKIKENVRESLEQSLKDVEDYPKGADL
jgi:hypothetical protein